MVHEIYAGHSEAAYNKLKSIITDDWIRVRTKFLDDYDIRNRAHMFACSNSKRALMLDFTDRRWFVPHVTNDPRTRKYWAEFNRWLEQENGLAIILQWALDFVKVKRNAVAEGEIAPTSEAKVKLIEENYSDGQRYISEVLDNIIEAHPPPPPGPDGKVKVNSFVVLDRDILQWMKLDVFEHSRARSGKLWERALTVRQIAKAKGLLVSEVPSDLAEWGGIQAREARFITNNPQLLDKKPAQLKGEKVMPVDAGKHRPPLGSY